MPGQTPVWGPFVDLPDGARDSLLRFSRRQKYSAGQLLFDRGDSADDAMIVQSGLVAVQDSRPDGRRLILAVCGREDVLGEMALAGLPRRTAAVLALRDTDVLAIDARKLAELRTETSEVDRAVMGVMADTVRRLTDQLLEALLLPQASRLRRVLVRLHQHFPDGRIEITQDLLADMLGAPRTTVSELLADEEAAGSIAKGRGFVRVLDSVALAGGSRESA